MVIRDLRVEVIRKNIQNLHVGVYPPAGRVRVAAPIRLKDEAVRLAIVSKLGWIRRQQRSFCEQSRESKRLHVSGETMFVGGRRYRVRVVHDGHRRGSVVSIRGGLVELAVRQQPTRAMKERLVRQWYRRLLLAQIPLLLDKWQPRVGATVHEVRIKRMKTRWGSCNESVGRIWLNLELAKKPARCLEYIVVHELVHLRHRHHDSHFRQQMDRLLPSWKARRAELNRAPLAHEEWGD